MTRIRTCKIRNCGREARAKNLCSNHYSQKLKYGAIGKRAPHPWKRSNKRCSIPNCGREHYAKNYCRKHYNALITRGGYRRHLCKAQGCSFMATGPLKYCQRHRERIKSKLSLDLSIKCYPTGSRNVNWKGGISEYPNHSLMKKNRLIILIHNPKCEYCGRPATEVHHKDGSKINHSLSNLMAVCHKCHPRSKVHDSFYRRRYGMTLAEMGKGLGYSATRIRDFDHQGVLDSIIYSNPKVISRLNIKYIKYIK